MNFTDKKSIQSEKHSTTQKKEQLYVLYIILSSAIIYNIVSINFRLTNRKQNASFDIFHFISQFYNFEEIHNTETL